MRMPARSARAIAMSFARSYPYRFGDIDDAGIAYYPKLLHYFHCAMEDWIAEAVGRSYHKVLREDHFGLPAVKLEAEFFAPIRYGDEPTVHLGVLRVGERSLEIGFWMTLPDAPDEPRCRARVVVAGVDMRTLRAVQVPDFLRAAIDRYRIEEADFPRPARRRD
jgi:acyl-CoA thioesterase FadM